MRRNIVRFAGWMALGMLAFGGAPGGVTIGLENAARADDGFCSSQLKLVDKYLGPLVKPPFTKTGNGSQAVGMMVVTLKLGEQPCFMGGGEIELGTGKSPDPDTIFELASVTKVFTTAILGLHEREFFDVTQPVTANLPDGFDLLPEEAQVTYQQLATFTGGFWWSDPPGSTNKETYPQKKFEKAVSNLIPRDPVSDVEPLPTYNNYSNSSVGFLGQILMHLDGEGHRYNPDATGFSNWISHFVTDPLNMPNTSVSPDGTWAKGYKLKDDGGYKPEDPFPWQPWGAAGALRSSAGDMLNFLRASICAHHMNDAACTSVPRKILEALAVAQTPNTYMPSAPADPIIYAGKEGSRVQQAWAWNYLSPPNPNPNNETPILEKGGAHAGFGSWIAINPHKSYGIVILTNTGHVGITAPGRSIIEHTHAP